MAAAGQHPLLSLHRRTRPLQLGEDGRQEVGGSRFGRIRWQRGWIRRPLRLRWSGMSFLHGCPRAAAVDRGGVGAAAQASGCGSGGRAASPAAVRCWGGAAAGRIRVTGLGRPWRHRPWMAPARARIRRLGVRSWASGGGSTRPLGLRAQMCPLPRGNGDAASFGLAAGPARSFMVQAVRRRCGAAAGLCVASPTAPWWRGRWQQRYGGAADGFESRQLHLGGAQRYGCLGEVRR